MKEVIYGEELQNIILEGTNLICNAVSSTLGPLGNNVIINKDDLAPFITNDGVTIAESISSNDSKINTILEIIKEASLKTNETVGDGTTTTLVLLKSIINEGFKEIKNGKKPIILKHELDNTLNIILSKLTKLKRKPTNNDLKNIAIISANDKELGTLLSNIYLKMKRTNSLKLEESLNGTTYIEIQKGYNLEIDNIPSIYFKTQKSLELSNPYICLLNGYLNSLEQISNIINEGLTTNKNIVILVNDYDENMLNDIILFNVEAQKNIFLFKVPDYGVHKKDIMEDLSALTNTKIHNLNYEDGNNISLIQISKVIIKENEVIIINDNKNLKTYLKKLNNTLNNTYETYEKEFVLERYNKLKEGIATIYLSASTKTELKEKIMRATDAINALYIASNGIVPGEGITYLKISEEINNEIMKIALTKPFYQIMENAGENSELRKNDIKRFNYQKVYNFNNKEYEDINTSSIIDPYLVSVEAIKNAVSIASMLLTTNYLVINESKKYHNDNIDL